MSLRFALLAVLLTASCLAGGCRGLTGGGLFARTNPSESSGAPSQPASLQSAQNAELDRTTTDDLIRRAAFSPGQVGDAPAGSPPLPPFMPEMNGPSQPPQSDMEFVQTPFGPAERFSPGGHYLNQGPTISGEMLARERAVTATERALELAEQLDQTRAEKAQLQSLIEDLQTELQSKNELLERAEKELAYARTDLEKSREKIEQWANETDQLKKRMESREKSHDKAFNELVELINTMIEKQQSPSDEAAILSP